MQETTDYLDNIVDLIHAARKIDKRIGARLKHFYANKDTIKVQLSGNGYLTIGLIYAQNGVSQITKEAIQSISDTFETIEGR
jgi:hypothetical protein